MALVECTVKPYTTDADELTMYCNKACAGVDEEVATEPEDNTDGAQDVDAELQVSPRRKRMREEAHGKLVEQANKMRKRALNANAGRSLEVGDVVQIALEDVDR